MGSGLVAVLAGWAWSYYHSAVQEQRKAQIERVNQQLEELYGPLLACVTATKSAYAAMVRQHALSGPEECKTASTSGSTRADAYRADDSGGSGSSNNNSSSSSSRAGGDGGGAGTSASMPAGGSGAGGGGSGSSVVPPARSAAEVATGVSPACMAAFQREVMNNPHGPVARAYRQWMTGVLQPLNEKAAEIVQGGWSLLEVGSALEPHLLQLVAHVYAYRVILDRWSQGDLDTCSALSYPDGLEPAVRHEYAKLRRRQAELLGTVATKQLPSLSLGRKGNAAGKSGGSSSGGGGGQGGTMSGADVVASTRSGAAGSGGGGTGGSCASSGGSDPTAGIGNCSSTASARDAAAGCGSSSTTTIATDRAGAAAGVEGAAEAPGGSLQLQPAATSSGCGATHRPHAQARALPHPSAMPLPVPLPFHGSANTPLHYAACWDAAAAAYQAPAASAVGGLGSGNGSSRRRQRMQARL